MTFWDESGQKHKTGDTEMIALAMKIGEWKEGNSWYLMATTDPGQHAYLSRTLHDWHIILGHADPRNILRMHAAHLSKGLNITKTDAIGLNPNFDCVGCVQGKSHVCPFPDSNSETPCEIGNVIYSDVWGLASKYSLQGNEYYIVFVDGATRFMFVHFMRHKSEAVDRYIAFSNFIHTQKGKEIKRIHFDNGKELINKRLRTYCDSTGTEITMAAPYSSQQNGPAERVHRTLADQACSMLHGHLNTRGKTFLWQEAISYACTISNNLPHSIRGEWCVPQIDMFGKPIDLSYFQLFGSTCHVLIQKKSQSKIEAKMHMAIFTGIDRNSSGAWRYFAPPDCAIRTSRNVFFPRHLPDLTSLNDPLPIAHSESAEDLDSKDWVQIFTPSEGEMGLDSAKSTHTHNTRSEISPIDDSNQGEPPKPLPAPLPTRSRSSDRTEHVHIPIIDDAKLSVPADCTVPGISSAHITCSQAAGKAVQHVALDEHGKPHCALWLMAINDICKQTALNISVPTIRTNQNFAAFPMHVINCFHSLHSARAEDLSCFDTWIARNFNSASLPSPLGSDPDSPKWSDALKSNRRQDWIEALESEMQQLIYLDIYEDFPHDQIPRSRQLLSSGIVGRIKRDADGSEIRVKARVVVHGNRQIAGLSYGDTFSNTPDLSFIHATLVVVAYADLDCHMIDVTGAYTHAPIDCELYVEYPEGYGKGGLTVMKLKKALYGAHQSSRLWEQYRNARILTLGYHPNQKDVSIFTRTKNGVYSIIICYVDDFVICCTAGHIESIKKEILDLFDCKDLGELKLFIGIAIKRDRAKRTLSLLMESYIKNIVKMADLHNAAPTNTPMPHSQPILEPVVSPDYSFLYIMHLGRLFWVAHCCRPDISFVTSLLARFSNCYGTPHISILKQVFRYLAATANLGIIYNRNKPFYEVGYSNADYTTQHGRKSITGSLVIMGGAAVSWASKRQTSVSLSTMEAEFIALCNTAKDIISIRQFLNELGIRYETPVASPIFCDNQAVIEAVHNPTHKTRAKHIDIAYNFIHNEIYNQKVSVSFIPTRDNLADALTKPLAPMQHYYLTDSFLGIPERSQVTSSTRARDSFVHTTKRLG
ncbi:Copia protein [Ceratobasidium theobromae]|uniref:Copia protein n=1 Tax=Ceratobasidium theobromae TaxID=1582974 RepID=A0A5N5QBK0_9AGAM|nr:Copia protein [Ceratobasidium theobromae]